MISSGGHLLCFQEIHFDSRSLFHPSADGPDLIHISLAGTLYQVLYHGQQAWEIATGPIELLMGQGMGQGGIGAASISHPPVPLWAKAGAACDTSGLGWFLPR